MAAESLFSITLSLLYKSISDAESLSWFQKTFNTSEARNTKYFLGRSIRRASQLVEHYEFETELGQATMLAELKHAQELYNGLKL